jgi:hypothetical protein
MDPDATLLLCCSADPEEARDAAEDLLTWLRRGGFPPAKVSRGVIAKKLMILRASAISAARAAGERCDYCDGPGGVPRGDVVSRIGDTLLNFSRRQQVCAECWEQLNSDQRSELAE